MKIWHGINDFDDFMLVSIFCISVAYLVFALVAKALTAFKNGE